MTSSSGRGGGGDHLPSFCRELLPYVFVSAQNVVRKQSLRLVFSFLISCHFTLREKVRTCFLYLTLQLLKNAGRGFHHLLFLGCFTTRILVFNYLRLCPFSVFIYYLILQIRSDCCQLQKGQHLQQLQDESSGDVWLWNFVLFCVLTVNRINGTYCLFHVS